MADRDIDNSSQKNIPSFSLKGHTGSILCLDYKSAVFTTPEEGINDQNDNLSGCGVLLSGSEDFTARLWDLREKHNLRASLCFITTDEVTSVAFGNNSDSQQKQQQHDITPTLDGFSRDYSVFLSVNSQVWRYDLRKANAPIIKQDTYQNIESIIEADDEINQIVLSSSQEAEQKQSSSSKQRRKNKRGRSNNSAVNKNRSNSHLNYLAAGDDTGKVQIVELTNDEIQQHKQPSSKLRVLDHENVAVIASGTSSLDDPENVAMVTSCVFRPCCKGLEIVSGGTDCRLHLWDANKTKRPISSYTITSDTNENANQLCNPPMIHYLSWNNDGKLLATGLGDGTCGIFSIENRSLVMIERFQSCQSSVPVASVLFAPSDWLSLSQEMRGTGANTDVSDRLLFCAGNDGHILLWDINYLMDGNNNNLVSNDQGGILQTLRAKTESLAIAEDNIATAGSHGPNCLLQIDHKYKANWMICSNKNERYHPSTLFVADTSNDITAYMIPI